MQNIHNCDIFSLAVYNVGVLLANLANYSHKIIIQKPGFYGSIMQLICYKSGQLDITALLKLLC
jgi:hypothetical protein